MTTNRHVLDALLQQRLQGLQGAGRLAALGVRSVALADITHAVVTAELRKDVPGDDDADEEE